ncbi:MULTISPECIES: hypothetical protein [Mycobacterium]|uniref:DUF7159 domain-containing protein n=1 Tax=Mycobacterium syngnathidarum TaxID=1908205 RepID=A0A1Q9WBU0_9MYCO|nr:MULTISPECIES: hypothetical protein [Mycobacterium]MCG7609913.1 hypothetical protein [Mycobacterium sp. CnD-18-1]OHT93465.1 hypothetical protein BKG61_21125 [Mycobacterium syngnathidarum]OLT96268.1 hypothetical protein BKG60_12760 [Mycobacterium syngnathidarum]
MKAVLGLSVTSHAIAWALVHGDAAAAEAGPLDDDAFDVEVADQVAARAAAAARSARAIAAASGQDVAAVGVTDSGLDGAAGDQLARLLDRLAATGFDDVRIVAEPTDDADVDECGMEAQLREARAAAYAVAIGAVPRVAPEPVAHRRPAPRKHRGVRVAAAAAATVAAGMLTVGSQFTEPAPIPAGEQEDTTAAAPAPRVVTVAAPRLSERAVTMRPSEVTAPAQVVENVEQVPAYVPPVEPAVPVPRAQPVAVVQTTVPQAVPVVQMAVPAHAPDVSNMPAQQPGGVPAAYVPAAQPHLPTSDAHVAADPSPGPALASPGPVPVPVPAPAPATPADPISGWLLAAMP